MIKTVVWHQYFDNSPRCDCCTKHLFEPDDSDYSCPKPYDEKAHGSIEWLRFVWAMNSILKENAPADFDYAQDDALRVLGGFGSPLGLHGTMKNPANIADNVTGEIWRGVEEYDNFTIYTNALTHRCLIECYNPKFVDMAKEAAQKVADEYDPKYDHKCVRM